MSNEAIFHVPRYVFKDVKGPLTYYNPKMFLYILLCAKAETSGEKYGTLRTTAVELSYLLNRSQLQIRTWLSDLKKAGMVTINPDESGMLITITHLQGLEEV